MTSSGPEDFEVRLLAYALSRSYSEVNSVASRAVSEVNRGELNKETAAELRAALLDLEEVLSFYDEAANPDYCEEVNT